MDTQSDISHLAIPEHARALQAFVQRFGIGFRIILHPCCLDDTSPSTIFTAKDTSIYYVDINEEAVGRLLALGLNAQCADIDSFTDFPGPADLIILLNSCPRMDLLVSKLESWGYLLCNDFYAAARYLQNRKDFSHVGAIRFHACTSGQAVLEQNEEDLAKYWSAWNMLTSAGVNQLMQEPGTQVKEDRDTIHIFQKVLPGVALI